jgi:hypothetical protein
MFKIISLSYTNGSSLKFHFSGINPAFNNTHFKAMVHYRLVVMYIFRIIQ